MLLKELDLDISMLNQELAWYSILLEPIKLQRAYRNPTRLDNHPSCKLFISSNGDLLLKDYSNNETYNCVLAYSKIHHISYRQALSELYFNVSRTTPIQTIKIEKVKPTDIGISIVEKPFTEQDENYWSNLGLTKDDLVVDSFSVKSVESCTFTFTDKESSKSSSKTLYPSDLAFAYVGNYNGLKLYFPERNKAVGRFKNTLKDFEVFFKIRSTTNLIITKSHKDFLILNKMIKESGLDWSVTHVQSESSIPIREELNYEGNIVLLLDNDNAGIQASERFKSKYPHAILEYIPVEKGKDISDFITNYSYKEAYKFISSLLIKHYVI